VNLHFLQRGGRGIFNCGSGQARSFLAIAQTLREQHGSGEIAYVPFPSDLQGKYQRFTQADLQQLRAAGCDHTFTSLQHGLEQYYRILHEDDGYRR
jgi:ADP-L-glycero-D-manno-heptose 6-epimerase